MTTFKRETGQFTYRLAGVAIHEGHVLLHRAERDDFWVLPGGRAELGEPATLGLRREMQEELDTDVTVERLLWVLENFFTWEDGSACHELGLYFLIHLPAGSPFLGKETPFWGREGDILLEFRWFELARLGEILLYPSFLREGLRRLPEAPAHVVHVDDGE